jgi:DNA-directed RNA polymerase subunit RPC12/RpoP
MTILKQRSFKDNDVIDIDYCCNFCGYTFTKKARKTKGVSTQIKCPYCENFIKTWS